MIPVLKMAEQADDVFFIVRVCFLQFPQDGDLFHTGLVPNHETVSEINIDAIRMQSEGPTLRHCSE